MGIKLMTLCYAAAHGVKVTVNSRKGMFASVSKIAVKESANHPYPVDFILCFEDGKKYRVYWDQFRRAHLCDENKMEVPQLPFENEIVVHHPRHPTPVVHT